MRRVEYLVEVHGVDPKHITAITFTRAAAAEMKERLHDRLGDAGKRVKVSTLHSYALRELLTAQTGDFPLPLRVVGTWRSGTSSWRNSPNG